jgi:hypothetical protein
MAIHIETETNGLLKVIISNLMTGENMIQCQEAIVSAIKLYGTIKGLMVLDAFKGWEKSDVWKDGTFCSEHENKIEKIAVVGDLNWRDDMFAFLGGPFRSAPIEFFNPSQEPEARTWLE